MRSSWFVVASWVLVVGPGCGSSDGGPSVDPEGDGDADADADTDVDGDADADADADGDADGKRPGGLSRLPQLSASA